MTARITAAAELVVRTMLGQDGTPASIVQALGDANLLQPEGRPAEIACQADLVAALRELESEKAATAEAMQLAEDAVTALRSYELLVPKLEEQAHRRDRLIQRYEEQVATLLDRVKELQAIAGGRRGGSE